LLLKPLKEVTNWIGESFQNCFEKIYKDWNWKVYDHKYDFWNRKLKWFFENHDHIKWSEFSKGQVYMCFEVIHEYIHILSIDLWVIYLKFIKVNIPNLNLAWRNEKELLMKWAKKTIQYSFLVLCFKMLFLSHLSRNNILGGLC